MGVWSWHCCLEEPCEASLLMEGRRAGTQQIWCPCCQEGDFSQTNLRSEYSCWRFMLFFCAQPWVFFCDDSPSLWTKEFWGLQSVSVKRVRPWAAEHALTLFSYAERLEVEPELRCVSNPGQKGTEAGLRERETKLCNWMTNNHTKLPIPSGDVCSALLCTAQALSLQFSNECHTIFLPSRSKCMSDWASECGSPKWRKWVFSLLQISVKKMLTIVKRKWIWS